MLLVIDTNIIVNALKSGDKQSKSYQLMRDVMIGKHTEIGTGTQIIQGKNICDYDITF